jgi:hypothetical protein
VDKIAMTLLDISWGPTYNIAHRVEGAEFQSVHAIVGDSRFNSVLILEMPIFDAKVAFNPEPRPLDVPDTEDRCALVAWVWPEGCIPWETLGTITTTIGITKNSKSFIK